MPDRRQPLPATIEDVALAAFWDACALNHDTEHVSQAVRSATRAVLIHLGGVGACGEECAPLFAGGERLHCELLAGHTGWHEAGEGPLPTRWNLRPGVSDLEWRVVMPGGTTRYFSDFYSARRFASTIPGARVESRAVTTYPDGSTLATPWREDSEHD